MTIYPEIPWRRGIATHRCAASARPGVTVVDWLIPDADYAKLPRPSVGTTMPRPPQIAATADGPASTRLVGVLADVGIGELLPGVSPPILTDRKSPGAPVAGCVTYEFADRRVVSAVQQQMMRPFPYSVVGLTDGARLTERPTGSVLVSYPGRATNQVFLITTSGLMTTLTASGVHAAPPLTIEQLVALATAVDSRTAETSAT
jgi:hypothetical protein